MGYLKSICRRVYCYEYSGLLFFYTLIFLLNIPLLYSYSENFIITLARFGDNCDELSFFENVDIILNLLFDGRIKGFGYNLYSFGYGSIFWLLSSLVSIPAWLYGSERGVIITLRVMTLLFSLGALYLVSLIIKDLSKKWWHAYAPAALLFCSPLIMLYSTFFHPEAMYSFFLVLALYYLHQDNMNFGRAYYLSLVAFSVALSVKILAALFGVVYLFYLAEGYKKARLSLSFVMKSLLVGVGAFFVQNVFLVFPLILSRYYRWVTSMSGKVSKAALTHTLSDRIGLFSLSYLHIILFFLIVLFSFMMLVITEKNKNERAYNLLLMALMPTFAYFLFCLFYTAAPFHYGIVLLYFIPLLVLVSLVLFDSSKCFLSVRKYAASLFLVVCMYLSCSCLQRSIGIITTPSDPLNGVSFATMMFREPSGFLQGAKFASDLENIRLFVQNLSHQEFTIGFDLGLAVPKYKNKKMILEPLHIKASVFTGKFDYLFLFKSKENEELIASARLHGCPFIRVFDGHRIEIYERLNGGSLT